MFGNGAKRKETVLPHAVIEDEGGSALPDGRFHSVATRMREKGEIGDPDWLCVDGRYYVVGESAEQQGVVTRRTGSAKYTREYMGALLIPHLLRVLPDGNDNVFMYVSFPPGDVDFTEDLGRSLLGKWDVETVGSKRVKYRVRSVQVYDEPLGGFLNAYCDRNGDPYKDSALSAGSTLVFDVGGKVSSVLRVLVQYGSALSIQHIGGQSILPERQ